MLPQVQGRCKALLTILERLRIAGEVQLRWPVQWCHHCATTVPPLCHHCVKIEQHNLLHHCLQQQATCMRACVMHDSSLSLKLNPGSMNRSKRRRRQQQAVMERRASCFRCRSWTPTLWRASELAARPLLRGLPALRCKLRTLCSGCKVRWV